MRQALLALLLAIAWAPLASATAIVLFRTPERVVLAADSITIRRGGTSRTGTACKVRHAGPWWFVVGGYEGHDGGARPIDAFAAIATALAPARTLGEAMAALQRAWRTAIEPAFAEAAAVPAIGAELVVGGVAWTVAVGGVEDGVPVAGALQVLLTRREPPAFLAFPAACPGGCADGKLVASASVDGPLVRLTRPPRPAWVERADVAAAKRLIELQAAATPDLVGGRISIVEITAAGARWVSGRCQ